MKENLLKRMYKELGILSVVILASGAINLVFMLTEKVCEKIIDE